MIKQLIKQTNERGLIKYIVRFNNDERIYTTKPAALKFYNKITRETKEVIIQSEEV